MKLEQLNFRCNVTDIAELFKIRKGFTCYNIVNNRFVYNNTIDMATYSIYLFCDCFLNHAVPF